MASETKYERLLDDLENPAREPSSSRQHHGLESNCWKVTRYMCAVIIGFIFGAITVAAVPKIRQHAVLDTGLSSTTSNNGETSWDRQSSFLDDHSAISDDHSIGDLQCGTTWQEAKAKGCRFDVLAGRWYSAECASFDVLDVMLQEIQLEWFADEEHSVPVSQEMAYAGEYEWLYPLHDYHILHCLYLWRRFHIAVLEHRIIDADLLSYGHTLHCTRMILKWPEEIRYGKNTTTKSPSRPPHCIAEPM